jgi:hypothetical protein
MNNLLNNDDYVAGVLAVASGDLEVQTVAEGQYESTVYSWYWIHDTRRNECQALLVGTGDDTTRFYEKCPPNDKVAFTQAFLKTLRFGIPKHDAYVWFCSLINGWADPEWISIEILKEFMDGSATELKIDFNFNVWAVNGGLQNRPKRRRRK